MLGYKNKFEQLELSCLFEVSIAETSYQPRSSATAMGRAKRRRRREVREAGADTVKRACGLHGSGVGPQRGEPFEDVASKAVPDNSALIRVRGGRAGKSSNATNPTGTACHWNNIPKQIFTCRQEKSRNADHTTRPTTNLFLLRHGLSRIENAENENQTNRGKSHPRDSPNPAIPQTRGLEE